jgi:cbb3-type cytochrome oxidase subunit 3
MYQDFYRDSTVLGFASFALVLFFAVFISVVVITFRRGRRSSDIETFARLPFSDDDAPTGQTPSTGSGELRHV